MVMPASRHTTSRAEAHSQIAVWGLGPTISDDGHAEFYSKLYFDVSHSLQLHQAGSLNAVAGMKRTRHYPPIISVAVHGYYRSICSQIAGPVVRKHVMLQIRDAHAPVW